MNSSTHPYEQEEVMAYLDGELSADRAAGVAAHLRECAECAELAEQMRGVSVSFDKLERGTSPGQLDQKPTDSETGYVRSQKKISRKESVRGWIERFAPLRGTLGYGERLVQLQSGCCCWL